MTTGEIVSKGKNVLKGRWLTALFLALAVNLPSLLVQILGIRDSALFNEQMTSLILNWTEKIMAAVQNGVSGVAEIMTAEAMTGEAVLKIVEGNRMLMWWGLSVLAWIISPFLLLGLYHWMEELHRGTELGFATIFSRIGRFFGALFLRILIAVKVFAWMLPGFAVCLLGYLLVFLTRGDSWLVLTLFNLLFTVGTAASVFLSVRAALSYSMSEFVMADNDRKGTLVSIRESKELTKGQKGRVLGVMVMFILLNLVSGLVTNLLTSLFGSVVGDVIHMLINLALAVLQTSAMCALYFDLMGEKSVVPEPDEDDGDIGI